MHAHEIVHRDIKLENVLLDENLNVKLSDLGMATDATTKLKDICGTPDYIAPEVLEDRADLYDARKADIYSMGICLFMLLTGQPLYQLDLNDSINSPLQNTFYCNFIMDPESELTRRKLYLKSNAIDLIKGMIAVDPSERMTLE